MEQFPQPIDFASQLERLRDEHGATLPHGERYLYTINGGTPFKDRADKERIETAYFTGNLNNQRRYQSLGADVKSMDRFFRHRELPDSEKFSKPGFQLKTA